ncbi:hypothetical protein ACTMSW_18960 [Micromonospora sp. BQ11]|uniref:hypothetical protein n=1 Tax=Micromonospora sp. BQ11 TaxID=3452212 RepID=UPI003F8A0CAD
MSPVPTGPQRRPDDAQAAPRMILSCGVDTRIPPLPALTSGRRGVSRPAVAVAALAATLIAGQLSPPPARQSPLLVAAPRGCGVPSPTEELSDTSHHPPPTRLRSAQPGRPILLGLARRITTDACDTAEGRYDAVHHRVWTTRRGRDVTRDVVRWYADDDSGAELMTEHPDPRPGVARDFWPPGWLHDKNLFRAYQSTDWLRSQADFHAGQVNKNGALMAGLASLNTWHNPGPRQRALTAQVLADAAGLTAHPGTVDRAGRTGLAVASFNDDGRERHLLILHPRTSAVLAYESAILTPTGWRTGTYLLLLTRTRAPDRWWEPPTDSNPPPRHTDRREMPSEAGIQRFRTFEPCITTDQSM